jgi:hypothetical protein
MLAGTGFIICEALGLVAHGALIGLILVVVATVTYVSARQRLK